jgi:di/tricarboxylate transporter
MGFAAQYGISPMLVGLMVVNGASAGSLSPIGIFGTVTNGVVERNNLPGSPLTLFLASLLFNVLLAAVSYLLFYKRPARATTAGAPDPGSPGDEPDRLTGARGLTLLCLLALATGALLFGLDVGYSAFVAAVLLSAVDPRSAKGAITQIAWPTVLLVCGIVTYVSLMEGLGTIAFLGREVAAIGTALLGALLICYVGGVVSAFASTTGILGALIPLAVPFLQSSDVSPVGLIAALAISSSVVDSSPFSTSGSLVVANAPEAEREQVLRQIMRWGFAMVLLAPITTWLLLVLPGWL